MTQSAIALTLGNITIRQHNGLFSLNDLHKAAGGEAKHQPALFMRMEQTQALITEIGNSTDSQSFKTKEGRNGGTYACRELVIAYAAWISAAFHLKVIRVFLSATTPQANPAIDYDRISPAQAQDLKEIVAAIVQAGIQGYGETWARLQRKFRVNSYLELPATQHLEARPTCWPSCQSLTRQALWRKRSPPSTRSTPRPWPPPANRPTNTLTRPAKANTCSSPPHSRPKSSAACWPRPCSISDSCSVLTGIFAASLGVQPEVRANRLVRPVVLLRSPAVN